MVSKAFGLSRVADSDNTLYVDSSNNRVGIGTNTPTANFHVVGDTAITGDLKANSGYGSAATMYGVRAWLNANGVGTVSIRRSENVSSLTDHGIGDYTINFTNSFPDANYSLSGACNQDLNGWGQVEFAGISPAVTTMNTSAVRIRTIGYTTYGDYSHITVMVVR